MKKFIAIIACLAIVLSLAACGGNGGDGETTTVPTTVEETTTTLFNVTTRFNHKATMNVWTKGEKVSYEEGATKIMTATAALNDSVIYDTFAATDKKADFKDMKQNASCVEFSYETDQTATFLDEKVVYDQVIVATSGGYVNVIFFLKDGAVVGSPIEAKKGADREHSLSENIATAVRVIVHEDHTH